MFTHIFLFVRWPSLLNQFHPNATKLALADHPKTDDLPSEKVKLEYSLCAVPASAATKNNFTSSSVCIVSSLQHFFTSSVCIVGDNRELRAAADGGSSRHVDLDIAGAGGLAYTTADNLGVLPENPRGSVEAVAARFGLNLNEVLYCRIGST